MDKRIDNIAAILTNREAGAELSERGYTIFPFLEKDDQEQLIQYYNDFQTETPGHFYSSTHSPDFTFRKNASDFIKGIIERWLAEYMVGVRLLGGAFVVKPPHGKGLLPPHQDWNMVNEAHCRSYNLWIPLTDVSVENGAVFVLPGSHKRMPTWRGPGIPSIFDGIGEEVWKVLQPLPMPAGSALFYDHALLHASPVNKTDKIRLGVVCGVMPADATMELCFNNNGKVDIYAATEHFFLECNPMDGPVGLRYLRTETSGHSRLNAKQFGDIYVTKSSGAAAWLKKIFARGH